MNHGPTGRPWLGLILYAASFAYYHFRYDTHGTFALTLHILFQIFYQLVTSAPVKLENINKYNNKKSVVTLANRPKNTLFFIANDEKDFLRWQESWQRNGWLITSDFKDNTYEAIGFVNGQVVCLLYEMPKQDQPQDQPITQVDPNVKILEVSAEQEGAEAEAAAIDQLTSTS